jgi:hypothetical protein
MRAGVAIANAQENPDVGAALEAFGYDVTVLRQGQDLLDTVRRLSDAQRKGYGDQYAATAALNQAQEKLDRLYTAHRKLAAIAFKNEPDRLTALALDEARKKSLSGSFSQAWRFYSHLIEDEQAIEALGRFRITREQLEEGFTLLKQIETLNQAQEDEKSGAQRATKARDAAVDELHEWMSELKTVARIALADDPQLLESLQFGAIP